MSTLSFSQSPSLSLSCTHFSLAFFNTLGSSVARYILLWTGDSDGCVSSYHWYQSSIWQTTYIQPWSQFAQHNYFEWVAYVRHVFLDFVVHGLRQFVSSTNVYPKKWVEAIQYQNTNVYDITKYSVHYGLHIPNPHYIILKLKRILV